jgi:hypothetical protein
MDVTNVLLVSVFPTDVLYGFLVSVHNTFLIGGFYFIRDYFSYSPVCSRSTKWPFSCSHICSKNVKGNKYQQVYGRCADVEGVRTAGVRLINGVVWRLGISWTVIT